MATNVEIREFLMMDANERSAVAANETLAYRIYTILIPFHIHGNLHGRVFFPEIVRNAA
jgi:hypothetical protein